MEQKTSIWKSGLMLGVYLGIVVILYSVILYVTGMGFNQAAGYASIGILAVGIIIIQLNYKKEQGFLTYGQGVGVAVIAMISTGLISLVYTYMLYGVIDPEYHQQFMLYMEEQTTAKLIERGMGEDQIQMSIEMQQKFQSPAIMAGGALLNSVIVGAIVGLISSIFIKKNPSDEIPE